MVQLRDDHEQALAEIKSKQKLRDSAEQQVLFNEALAKLKEENTEKDNEIKQLKSNLHLKSKGKLTLFRVHHVTNEILTLFDKFEALPDSNLALNSPFAIKNQLVNFVWAKP